MNVQGAIAHLAEDIAERIESRAVAFCTSAPSVAKRGRLPNRAETRRSHLTDLDGRRRNTNARRKNYQLGKRGLFAKSAARSKPF